MSPRPATRVVSVVALMVIAFFVAACEEEGGDVVAPGGRLTDPSTVPTATPWPEPPEPLFLEEASPAPPPSQETEEGTPEAGTCGETYIVQLGDTPSSIAEKCGVDVDDLMALNGIDDPTSLQVGQELKIPQGGQSP